MKEEYEKERIGEWIVGSEPPGHFSVSYRWNRREDGMKAHLKKSGCSK